MSRLLRIIIFIIIVLLLIFFGFRCSQIIPNGSKATTSLIEKIQLEKVPSTNSNETAKNDTHKTIEATLPINEITQNTEHQNNIEVKKNPPQQQSKH